jgi:hypothetical protein
MLLLITVNVMAVERTLPCMDKGTRSIILNAKRSDFMVVICLRD